MTSFRTAIAIAVGTLFAGTALAQSNYEIEQRDRQQQARIYQGIQSGELTRNETRELMEERSRIERMERRARADGTLSQSERNRIDNAQDRLGRHIYQESHDRQDRNPGWRGRDNGHNGWDRNRGWDNRHSGWDRRDHNGRDHNGRDNNGRDNNGRDHNGRDHNNGQSDNGRQHGWNRGDQHNGSRGNGTGNTTGTGTSTTTTTSTNTSGHDRGAGGWSGRQASMPQAQARSTPSQGTRTFAASRQGGDSGRRSR